MRLAACMFLVMVLAGCSQGPGEAPSPEANLEPLPRPMEVEAPHPQPTPSLETPSPETSEAAAFTHGEGFVSVMLMVRLPSTSCDLGALAHHGIERTDNPDYGFDLITLAPDGWEEVLGAGSVPYPQGHASTGKLDSRPITGPAYDAAWGAWTTAAGFGETFTSGAWWRDVDLDAGTYRLEAVNTHGVDGGSDDLTKGGSLLVGLACSKPFEILASGEDRQVTFFSGMGADGETDVSAEMGTLDYHRGQLEREATGDCGFRTHVNNPHGEIRIEGPLQRTMAFSMEENLLFSEDFLRHAFQVPEGKYSVSWDLLAVYNSYWDLTFACYEALPSAQLAPTWSTPT